MPPFPLHPVPKLTSAALVLLSAAVASPAAAQRDDADWLERCRENRWSGQRAVHCEVRTERIPAPATLTVDGGTNGGASVHAWDGSDVRISARIQARARSEGAAEALARQVRIETSGGTVRAEGPPREEGTGWSVVYEILVPRRQNLAVETRNGPVSVEGVHGRMRLSTQNGPVSLRRLGGDVSARLKNGPVTVELEGSRWEGAGLDVETRNGPVRLTLPERYSAELEVGTTRGPVRVDLPLREGYRSGKQIRTTLGSGGAPIRVVTTNGPLTVEREEG